MLPKVTWAHFLYLNIATFAVGASLQAIDVEYQTFSNTLFVTGEDSESSSCLLASLSLWELSWQQHNSYPFTDVTKCLPVSVWSQNHLLSVSSNKEKDEAFGHELVTIPIKNISTANLQDALVNNPRNEDVVQGMLMMQPSASKEDRGKNLVVFSLHQGSDDDDTFETFDSEITGMKNYWTQSPKYQPTITKYYHPLEPGISAGGDLPSTTSTTRDSPIWSTPLEIENVKRHIARQLVALKGDDTIVMAGSTFKYDDARGVESAHGFLVTLDGTTGEAKLPDIENRYRYTDSEDEWVTGICTNPSLSEKSSVYIVGTTTKHPLQRVGVDSSASSTTSLQAFIKMIDLITMETVWEQHWAAFHLGNANLPSQALAMDCAVSSVDRNTLFVTGIVKDGASIVERGGDSSAKKNKVSHGGDDVWVAKLDARFGNVQASEQMGSAGDEGLATRNSLIIDYSGNPIIVGHSNGGFGGDESKGAILSSELFVMKWDHQTLAQTTISTQAMEDTDGTTGGVINTSSVSSENSRNGRVLLICLFAAGFSLLALRFLKKYRDDEAKRMSIYDYLRKFRQGDTKMTVSATGGWHVTFTTKGLISHGNPRSMTGEMYNGIQAGNDNGLRRRSPYLDNPDMYSSGGREDTEDAIFDRIKPQVQGNDGSTFYPMELDGVPNDANSEDYPDEPRLV